MKSILTNIFFGYLPIVLVGLYMPNFSKKRFFFGVDISKNQVKSEEFASLRKLYYKLYGITSTVLTLAINGISYYLKNIDISSFGTLSLVVVLVASYAYINRKAVRLERKMGEVNIKSRYTYIYPMVFIAIFTSVLTAIRYGEKSLLDALLIPVSQILTSIAILYIYRFIASPNRFKAQSSISRRRWLMALATIGTGIATYYLYIQLKVIGILSVV